MVDDAPGRGERTDGPRTPGAPGAPAAGDGSGLDRDGHSGKRRRRGRRGGRGRRKDGAPGAGPDIGRSDALTEAPTEEIARSSGPTAARAPAGPPRPQREQPFRGREPQRPPQRRAEETPQPDLPIIPVDDDGWPTFDEPAATRPRVIDESTRHGLFANLDALDDDAADAADDAPSLEPITEPLESVVRGEDVHPEDEPPTEEFPALDAGAIGAAGSAAPADAPFQAAPGAGRDSGAGFRDDPRGPRRGRRGRRGGARREGPIAQPGADPYAAPAPEVPGAARPAAAVAPAGFDDGPDGDAGPRDAGHAPVPRGTVQTTQTPLQRSADRAALHFFHPERLEACQHAIKYHFRDITLLENALTHSSIKSDDRPSYERLEFLGDSVVGLIIAEHLYDLLPDCDEGEMTRLKSAVVSTDGLANAALEIGLEQYLAVGRGLMRKNEIPRSLIADVFEGVTGAVYLDRGYETAKLYVLDHLGPFVHRALSDHTAQNYKSVLQQVAQRDLGETPQYDAVREWGPEHTRQYEVVAVVGRRRFPAAHAPTKREAEQAAAKIALQVILVERGAGNISPKRRHDRGPSSGSGRGSGRGRGSRGGPRRGPRGGSRGGPR